MKLTEQKYTWRPKQEFKHASIYLPDLSLIGNSHISHPICCYTQFDPLKQVILGHIDFNACDNQQYQQYYNRPQIIHCNPFNPQLISHSRNNLQTIAQSLTKYDVKIVRVGLMDYNQYFQIEDMKSKGFCCFSPRDLPFIYADGFYQFPGYNLCRAKENLVFQWIEEQLEKKGNKVYQSWQPVEKFRNQDQVDSYKSEEQYFADAANLIKLGLDIIFLISQSGSKGAYLKFKQFMQQKYDNKVRVHPLQNVYLGVHIDTTFSIVGFNKKLQKYLVFAQGFRTNPTNIPAIFRGKNFILIDFIQFQQQYFSDQQFNICSNSIGMNFLTINSQLVFISHVQIRLKKIMEFYGIKAIGLENKYAVQLGGGLHCVTNDIYREDVHGFGKILQKDNKQLTREEKAGLFDVDLLQFLQSKGQIQQWTEICNQNNIFPQYAMDHLDENQKMLLKQKHQKVIDQYKQNKLKQ